MAPEVQEPTFSINSGGAGSWRNKDMVYVTMISASESKNRVALCPLKLPLYRTLFTLDESVCMDLVMTFLINMVDIPQAFFNGHGCDMVQRLSRMFRYSVKHHRGVDHFCAFIMVSKFSCLYNIVSNPLFFHDDDDQVPSMECVRSLACEGGVYSLPAGARKIKRLKVQDDFKEDNCAICLQGFSYGSEVAKLPCSHVYHFGCVLEWFVQRGTCPLCRFPCSQA